MRDRHCARRTYRIAASLALAALLGPSAVARAACTAAQIITNEPACQNATGTCFITQPHTVENGCTLDFGARDVRWSGVLTSGSHMATLRAQSLRLDSRIDGVGSGTGAAGGMIVIETTGDFTLSPSGQIDVSGNHTGGQIMIHAGGAASLSGQLQAHFLTGAAAGGLIVVTAAGNITAAPGSMISAAGGIDSDGGGEIDLIAGGALTLQSDPDISGLDGGFLELQAGGKLTMQGVNGSGGGDAGSGGCIDVTSGAGVELKGSMDATGAGGLFMSGGCGGLICVDGGLGDVTIDATATIDADGASPDGGGGQIAIMGSGSANIAGSITARGPAGGTCGGCMCVEVGYDVSVSAPTGSIDVSGGDSGGELDLLAARNMQIRGALDASGHQTGSLGGDVSLHAGERTTGSLLVGSTVDVRSNSACSQANGCGLGGTTDLQGCNVTINGVGAVLAGGPDAGENDLTARAQIVIRTGAVLDAVATVATGAPGANHFVYRAGHPPVIQGSPLHPGPTALVVTTCPTKGQTEPPCLSPCPTCGNGMVEFPETCDLGVMPPRSCGGCSIYCQLENCDDGSVCTGDSCDPTFGCVNQPTPGCVEPTPTVTGTPPTPTATPSASPPPSASATRTITPSASPSSTPTPSITSSVTPTATITSTATLTATTTNTFTATVSPTATPTHAPTATSTPTITANATPTATATAPRPCPGDCNRSGDVAVNELVVGVNIALGTVNPSVCPAFDTNGDGEVSISELVAAVNAALDGC